MTSDLPRISRAQSRRFDPRALDKCPGGSARVGATNALSFPVPDGRPAASLSGWSRWEVDFARRRRPGPGPRGKGAGQKERNRLADCCARLHLGNHQVGYGVPSTGVLLPSQGCHTGILRCEVPGDLWERVLGVPGEYPIPSPSYPAHQLQYCKHPEGGAHEAQVGAQRRHRRSHALRGAAGPRANFRRELGHGVREPTTLRPRSRRCSGAATAASAAGSAWDPWADPTGARRPAPRRPRPCPSLRPRPLTLGSPGISG